MPLRRSGPPSVADALGTSPVAPPTTVPITRSSRASRWSGASAAVVSSPPRLLRRAVCLSPGLAPPWSCVRDGTLVVRVFGSLAVVVESMMRSAKPQVKGYFAIPRAIPRLSPVIPRLTTVSHRVVTGHPQGVAAGTRVAIARRRARRGPLPSSPGGDAGLGDAGSGPATAGARPHRHPRRAV